MKYNFDTTPDHKTNASFRWGMADMPSDVIGMGTADLDYYCAPCIRETLLPIAEENCYNYRQHTDAYYDAVYDCLGSETEEMYERGYDLIDVAEQEKCEKYLSEKANLLERLCMERGIKLWE
mgnify:CR=1 FL=1